jgi:hypothetical protein
VRSWKTNGRRWWGGVLVAGVLAALAASAPAGASTTIGHDLDLLGPPPTGGACPESCVFALVSLPADAAALGGVGVPTDGVIVAWRVRTANGNASTMALRLIRDGARGVGRSAQQAVPAVGGIYKYDTRLPVQAGDQIGLEVIASPGVPIVLAPGGGVLDSWVPAFPDGTATQPTVSDFPAAAYVQAELEPDCDRDSFGDETQDTDVRSCQPIKLGKTRRRPNGTATLAVRVPAPGSVAIARSKSVKSAVTAAKAPGTVKLTVRARGNAKRKLLETGRASVKIDVAYTPTSGVAQTVSAKAKLKRR